MPLIRLLTLLTAFLLCSGFYYPQHDLSDHLFSGTWEGSYEKATADENYSWTLKQNPDHSLVIHFKYLDKDVSIVEYGTWEVVDGIIFHHIQKVRINERQAEEKNLIFDYKILNVSPDKLTYQSLRQGNPVVYEAIRKP
jgi:hypothetical protein